METRVSIDQVAAVGQQISRDLKQSPRLADVRGSAFPGDSVSVTAGKEIFFPVKFQGFEVGPISFQTAIGPGESLEQAYGRASSVVAAMFEAEFNMKRVDYFRRLGIVEKPAK